MPISFIVVGFFLISNLFGFIKFVSKFSCLCLSLISVLILFGYFVENIFVGVVSFNPIFAIVSILIFIFFVVNKLVSFLGCMHVCMCLGMYYYLLSSNCSYMLSYDGFYIIGVVSVFLVSLFNCKVGFVVNLFLLSLGVVFLSGLVAYDNFFVFDFNFMFVIDVFVLSVLGYFIRKYLSGFLVIRFRKGLYVKESCVINDFAQYLFYVTSR